MATTEGLSNSINDLKINGEDSSHSHVNGSGDSGENSWGFSREELYRLALAFFKEKDGKAIQLKYQDRLKLVAYTKQASFGKYRPDISPDVGFLDVVGNDRRQAWQGLGEMTQADAMEAFIKTLDELCPLLKPYIEAHKAEKEEQERKIREEEQRKLKEEEEKERQKLEDDIRERQELERQRQQQQEMQIRMALNQQTAVQFRQYAEQQFPGNSEQQEVLIKQLQEQHYQQYMQQVYQQQLLHQQQQFQQLQAMGGPQQQQSPDQPVGLDHVNLAVQQQQVLKEAEQMPANHHHNMVNNTDKVDGEEKEDEEETDPNDLPPIAAASMWTRRDIKEFKDSLRKDTDSVVKVGSGETVTVRVPTHEEGTCLFWEFATDSYDLGFGVYFEWTTSPSNQVSVHVSESSDEDELEEEEGDGSTGKADVEKGGESALRKKRDNKPPTDEIIPVYRRDCHEEIYCGSHMYPGRGVYLLKFDNSYSLWRSKTLYYRVYYTR